MRDLKGRTKEFALRVIRLYTALPKRTEAQVIGKQLFVPALLSALTIVKERGRGPMRSLSARLRVVYRNSKRACIGWNF